MDQIIPAIAKAMGAVKKIGKDDRNAHDGYNFASIDAFLELVNPICAEHGILVHMEEEGIEDFTRKGKFGENAWMRVRFALTVYHASGQALPTVHRSVEVLRNGAQAYGAAQSYALKQFLRALLLIATGDADDADHRATDAGTIKAEPRRSAPQRAPEPPHDPETGEIPPNGNVAHAAAQGLHDAWEAGVLDSLPANANPRQKAEAFANQIIADFDRYKSMNGLRGYCSGKNKYFIRFETTYPDIAAQVQEAFDRAEVRINGDDPIVLGDVQITDDAGRPI